MCKIINGEEASEMMNATLDEIKLKKLITGLQQTKDIIDHNHSVVSEVLERMINALYEELEEIVNLF